MMMERAKTLAKALMGGEPSIPEALREDGHIRPLREMMEGLLKIGEADWGLYAFSREPLEGKFTLDQKYGYIENASECGCEEAKRLAAEEVTLESAVSYMEISLETPEIPVGGSHVIFAQFTEPDKITIYMDAVKRAEALILDNHMQDMLHGISIYQLLLAHELFHVIEFKKEASIYTKTEKIELWKKPFSNCSRIGCLSEIAGMAFAKEFMGLGCSPFVLDVLLMYGYSPVAATALYEEIMDIVHDIKN